MNRFDWRAALARLALVTLALSAAFGVYQYQLRFVPAWVAFVSAASFELTYIGLAVARLTEQDRRRATLISVGAVIVSVLYNSLSALFDIRPALLDAPPLWADAALAALHGVPLAFVAFLVADLLLHSGGQSAPMPVFSAARIADQEVYPAPVFQPSNRSAPKRYTCKKCGDEGFTFAELGRHSRNCKGEAA